MHEFTSGPKRNYYGKADVIVYRLNRPTSVLGANVTMLAYGEAFWPTYTTGDNSGLIATDSMKNFIQRETMNFEGADLESYCRYLGSKFLSKYPQTEGLQIQAQEIPFDGAGAFVPRNVERATARVEMTAAGVVERCPTPSTARCTCGWTWSGPLLSRLPKP